MSSSVVFIINALESIGANKECKRNKKLKESVHKALGSIKQKDSEDTTGDADIIFEPFQIACQAKVSPLMITSLDCIGKLFSYNYFIECDTPHTPASETKQQGEEDKNDSEKALIDRAVDVVCDCFVGENTDDQVQLQIIKALLAAVSSTVAPIHQSSLL
ncbi:15354_t:CDS:2, partial [Acaulospora morrowiae]